jgi:hypothetical protein
MAASISAASENAWNVGVRSPASRASSKHRPRRRSGPMTSHEGTGTTYEEVSDSARCEIAVR